MGSIRKTWYRFLTYQNYRLGVWSCLAMQWRRFSSRPVHPKHLFDEKRAVLLHELFSPGIVFLDLGSGVGSDCLVACDRGAVLAVGLECNLESIKTAMERRLGQYPHVQFMHFDLEQGALPFASNCFDVVNFSNVLEHLYNRNDILKELKRVKKEDGVAVISIPNADTSWKKKLRAAGLDSRDDPDHKIEYTRESLTEELGAAGLTIDSELRPIIPSFPWNGLIAMSAAISLSLYKKLQKKKRAYVKANPDESIGWVFTAR